MGILSGEKMFVMWTSLACPNRGQDHEYYLEKEVADPVVNHCQGQAPQGASCEGEAQTANQNSGKQLTLIDMLQGEQYPIGNPVPLAKYTTHTRQQITAPTAVCLLRAA
jgi:hypothetical protein